jgi:tetratricopeptide (TPR) repeat protein
VLALCRDGRGHDAVLALQRLIDLRPSRAELHILLGALLRRLHRADEAIRCFRWALTLPPAAQRFVLGEDVLGETGWAEVLASFKAAPRVSPGSPLERSARSR